MKNEYLAIGFRKKPNQPRRWRLCVKYNGGISTTNVVSGAHNFHCPKVLRETGENLKGLFTDLGHKIIKTKSVIPQEAKEIERQSLSSAR